MTKEHEHIEDLNDQMLVRRKKMNELREKMLILLEIVMNVLTFRQT